MLNIFVRKALAPRTLRQPNIATSDNIFRLGLGVGFRSLLYICGRLVGTREACEVWERRFGRWCGALGVSAVEDVIELGDGVATFDTDWHAAVMRSVTWLSLLASLKSSRPNGAQQILLGKATLDHALRAFSLASLEITIWHYPSS